MSARVAPEWLVLRESADAAARSDELAETVARHLAGADPLVVHDLGGGTGAMGRWLAPRLAGPQHWVVHDRDPELLEHAVAAPPAAAAVEARRSDVTRLAPGDLAGARLITASALLDMLTADELEPMVDACLDADAPVLLALTVTGSVDLTPGDSLDPCIEAAFNAHQRHARLGPDAVGAAVERFRAAGADVLVRPSPWHLDASDADLIAEWLDGWLTAACEQKPALAGEATAYRDLRLAQVGAGELAVTVDHADILVLP